jgi:hypothetical protein
MARTTGTTATKPKGILFGTKPKNAIETLLEVGDSFSDTPFFAPGMLSDTENMKALPEGSELIGIFKELRIANKNNPKAKPIDQYKYVCLETLEGQKFRVKAPGNLSWFFENRIKVGDLVSIIYNGKDMSNPDFPQGVHSFKVSKLDVAQ